MSEAIAIQEPTVPNRLVLLFHGVGGTPENMLPLARRLAAALPGAAVISVPSPDRCDMGAGYQWFSVRGVTEDNRRERVMLAMNGYVATIREMQRIHRCTPDQTVLVGFSQGGIMALESSLRPDAPANHVVSIAGRFVQLPQAAPTSAVFHLLHGARDGVIDASHSAAAARQLGHLGAVVDFDLIPDHGHGINKELIDTLVRRIEAM
jgi:phospholipase/carboxylesterase